MSEELHPLEAVTTLYLIRHGHTRATELGLLYSDTTIELTEKGKAQAASAAAYIKTLAPQLLICGKAKRVMQSAEPVEAETGLKAQSIDGFEEWQVGDWEGRTYLDIKKNDPDQYHRWCEDPIANAPPSGESIIDLSVRIAANLDKLITSEEYAGKTIAMVTHSGIIRSIVSHALGMPVTNFWRLSVPTGSVSRVDFSKSFATLHFLSLRP